MANPPTPPMFRDPWAKREAWRKHPIFNQRAMLSKMFPGFGVAVVAFTTYVIIDNMFLQAAPQSHH